MWISIALLACLVGGYAFADVSHPENTSIRGHFGVYGDDVCFNNDGSTDSSNCPDLVSPNEGYLWAESGTALDPGLWKSNSNGLIACSDAVVHPVSSATCLYIVSDNLAPCYNNAHLLVKTKSSGHYFTVKAGATCSTFNRPETEVIFPCLSTDAFDPSIGCYEGPKPTAISVKDSYIKLDTIDTPPSTDIDCDGDVSHEGRMVVDSAHDKLYICTESGWTSTTLTPLNP